jgi:predicted DNA-binding transcriptional regulator YafY
MKTGLSKTPTNVDESSMAKKNENRNAHVVRVLSVIKILERNPQGITAEDVLTALAANGIDVSIRTVYRDIHAIEEAHFPIEKIVDETDGRHLWHFSAIATVAGKIQISYEEIVALFISKEHLDPLKGTAFYKDIQSFFDKVEKLLGPRVQKELRQLGNTITFRATPMWATGIPQEVLDCVHHACVESHQILIDYKSNTDANRGKISKRKVGPLGIYLADSNIYLIAKDLSDGVVKKFALSRVVSAQWTDEPFSTDAGFSMEKQFKDDFGVLSAGEIADVTIRIAEPIASYVAERRWHESQRVIRKDDFSIEFSIRVRVNSELSRWILSLGPAAEVLSPQSLRDDLATISSAVAAKYKTRSAA